MSFINTRDDLSKFLIQDTTFIVMGVPGGGGGGLGKQSQSGNIRSTVGQYWLIIKKNGTNSVNFVGNCVNFVGNFVISGKFV